MPNWFKQFVFSLLFSIAVCLLFCTISCSKDPAIPNLNEPLPVRKVLIEMFTGHFDGHGAIATDTFQRIQQRYPDKVIGVTIHAGYFAKVFAAPYTQDFQCNAGDVYFKFLNIISNPIGTINRIDYPDRILKNYTGEWKKYTDSMVNVPAVASLKITSQYTPSTRMLSASVQCNFLGSLAGTYKLVVVLTEDKIIAPQKDYFIPSPNVAYQFVHRNVLRDGISSAWGDLLNTGWIAKGDSVIRNYLYNLPLDFNGMAPNENNCHVVAYIYDTSTYEVLQAEEIKMTN